MGMAMDPDKSVSEQSNLQCPESNAEVVFKLENGDKLNPVMFSFIVF